MRKGWLRVWRVAKFLDCSRDHIYDLVRAGKLEGVKIGQQQGIRISQESLEHYLAENRLPSSETVEKS
jgi:excisionase family DNA binding protein